MLRQWRHLLLTASVSMGVAFPVWAQLAPDGGGALAKRGWDIKPSISLDLTHTDNVSLKSSGGESDLITRLSPGVTLQGQSARASGYADFKVQQVMYASSEGRDRIQRNLNALGNVELVDNWLYLDLNGKIARQAVSAFSTPASGTDSINSNVIESSMYRFSPYIQGTLFGATDYQLRYDSSWYAAKNGPMRDTHIQSVQGSLSGGTAFSLLSWGLNGNAQQSTYSNNRKNETDALRGSLTYMLDPQFRVTAIGGTESNDYINFTQQTSSITGWGAEWSPGERTQIGWTQENRYFGDGHNFRFSHRTPSTAWRVSDTRDVMIRAPQTLSATLGTYYDMLNEQLKSQYPDENERARVIMATLQLMGISPDAPVIGDFMSSRASINRTKEISMVWTGVRNTITLSAISLDRTAIGTGIGVPDDFDISPTIRQKGYTVNWSHKVTPTASLVLMVNQSETSGNTNNLDTDRMMYSLILSDTLGAYTRGSIGLRRTEVSGVSNYDENVVLATLVMTF